MKEAQFLSIIADETTDVSNHCQLVIVFRYERNGKAVERFWCFKSSCSTADGLTEEILREIKPHLTENS